MKAFKAMAEIVKALPAETQKEILDALTEDFDELTELIEQSKLNNLAAVKKVSTAVDYANKRKDPNAKHFSRWNMQYAIRKMVVDCQQALNNGNDEKDGE